MTLSRRGRPPSAMRSSASKAAQLDALTPGRSAKSASSARPPSTTAMLGRNVISGLGVGSAYTVPPVLVVQRHETAHRLRLGLLVGAAACGVQDLRGLDRLVEAHEVADAHRGKKSREGRIAGAEQGRGVRDVVTGALIPVAGPERGHASEQRALVAEVVLVPRIRRACRRTSWTGHRESSQRHPARAPRSESRSCTSSAGGSQVLSPVAIVGAT